MRLQELTIEHILELTWKFERNLLDASGGSFD